MIAIISLAILGGILALGLIRPIWALAVIMSMFPIEQCFQGNASIFIERSTLTNLMVAGVVAVAMVRLFLSGRLVVQRWLTPTLFLTTLLYAWAATSYIWTFSPEWLAEYIKEALPYVLLIVYGGSLLVSSIDDISELRTSLMVVGSLVSVLLIINPNFQFFAGRYMLRLNATTWSNALAIGTLGAVLMLCAVLAPPSTGIRRLPILRIGAFIAGLGLAFLSGSRGQVMFAIFCGIIYYPLARQMKSFRNFAALVAGVVLIGIGVVAVRSFFVGAENEARWSAESLLFGGEGRIENVTDLANQYLRRPAFWAIGLGCLAFHDLPTTSGDPYSHVLVADLLFELGLPGVILFSIIAILTIVNAVRLFRLVSHDPVRRANATLLIALVTFEFMLANKAGQLWGQTGFFLSCALIARMSLLERDRAAAAIDAAYDADPEPASDADPLPAGAVPAAS